MQVNKPKGAPAWMHANIWKPLVKKVGTEMLEEATSKVVIVKRRK
jgi:Non-histone chromosomal protein MC1